MDKNEKSDSLFFTQWGQNIETMKRRLGYRLLLQDATFKRQVATGAPLEVEANLINVGWAAPFNARSVRLMLIPAAGGAAKSCPAEGAPAGCESVSAAADPRTWLPDARHTISGVIPTGKLPAGEYYLALEMADPLITKVNVTDDGIRARYSIRLANEEKQDGHFRWNPAEGLNYLGKVTLTK
jgi:hypothetical protein